MELEMEPVSIKSKVIVPVENHAVRKIKVVSCEVKPLTEGEKMRKKKNPEYTPKDKWYRDKVGEVFSAELVDVLGDKYFLILPDRNYIICVEDCEILPNKGSKTTKMR